MIFLSQDNWNTSTVCLFLPFFPLKHFLLAYSFKTCKEKMARIATPSFPLTCTWIIENSTHGCFPRRGKKEMCWLRLTAKTAETGVLWANSIQKTLYSENIMHFPIPEPVWSLANGRWYWGGKKSCNEQNLLPASLLTMLRSNEEDMWSWFTSDLFIIIAEETFQRSQQGSMQLRCICVH